MSDTKYGIDMLESIEEALAEIFERVKVCYPLRGCRQVIDAIEHGDVTEVIMALQNVAAKVDDATLTPEYQAWQSEKAARFISEIEGKIYQLVMVA